MMREITPFEIGNVMKLVGKDWLLITASDGERVNTMTASWGLMGVLWHKNVCTVFLRPQRYTKQFVDKAERISLSFFDEQYRDALKFCGTKSGRDYDKFAETGLTLTETDGVPTIREAKLTVICRKLYADTIREEAFLEDSPLACYPQKDYHTFYVCEIEKVFVRE